MEIIGSGQCDAVVPWLKITVVCVRERQNQREGKGKGIVVKRDKECVLVRKLCCSVTECQYGDGKSSVVEKLKIRGVLGD